MAVAVQKETWTNSEKGSKKRRGISALRYAAHRAEFERMTSGFISTAAHELRTPLTSILGFSELMLSQQQAGVVELDTQRECLGYIVENAKKLKGIVDTLLDLDQLQSGQGISLDRRLCKVESIVIGSLLPFHEKGGSKFLLRLSEGNTVVSVDRGKMQQVLKALVDNALKFSTGTPVCVFGHLAEGSYHLCVKDEGMGMTTGQVEDVFAPFHRVDSSNSAPEGIGLGLSWAKGIVEAHGGQIRVESEPGKGTRVTVSLPLD